MREIAGDRPPRYGWGGSLRFPIGRGFVLRQAIEHASDRGGQAPALREKRHPFRVGRGPVPRQAIGHASDRGGQAPALRGAAAVFFTVGRGPVPRQALATNKEKQ